MDRRKFMYAVAGVLAVWPVAARAQPAGRINRLGILRPTARPATEDRFTVESLIPSALRKLGYVEGRNLIIETRYADGDVERLPALARELLEARADVIVAVAHSAIRAALNATTTVPIIIWGNFDPVAAGYVKSLARPGGNVTGVLIAPEGTLAAKKLQLLKEVVPRTRRIAVLGPQDPSSMKTQLPELRKAASALGVELVIVETRNGDYERAFATIAAERPGALFVVATTYFVRDRRPIIELAAKYRLPAMWEWREQVEDGGLMAYGSSLAQRLERIATYVDRLFKGENPGDLPVDQPTKFELVINMNTAKALGVAIPQSLLLRADELIQ